MSTATTKARGETGRRAMPARSCQRCGGPIAGPVAVIEVSRLTHRGAECERTVACSGCADAVRSYLRGPHSPAPTAEPAITL
jgi:hypothetical protein